MHPQDTGWWYRVSPPQKLSMRERVTVVESVCLCVCVCPGKINFYVRLRQSFVVLTVLYMTKLMLDLKLVDFAKNAWVESFDDKYLPRRS